MTEKIKGHRKLADQARAKAIMNDVWSRVKAETGMSPTFKYIAAVALVDRMLDEGKIEDGRDIGDAFVLCADLGLAPTKAQIEACIKRVQRGRATGASSYR